MRFTHMTAIVSDLDRSVKWYKEILGMEVASDEPMKMGEFEMRWLTMKFPKQDFELALQPPMPGPNGGAPPKVGDGLMVVIQVEDCKSFISKIRGKATVAMEPEQLPWGLSAIIRDPDGNPYNILQLN